MPARSVAQQRFFGMVHAVHRGQLKHPSAAITRAAANISEQDAKDFATTRHEGLPKHVTTTSAQKSASIAALLKLANLTPTANTAPAKATGITAPVAPASPVAPKPAAPKMVMRMAPSVPNPIVPPNQSAMPMAGATKAAAATATQSPSGVRMAKNYTAQGRPGRTRIMPQPHAIQLKKTAATVIICRMFAQ